MSSWLSLRHSLAWRCRYSARESATEREVKKKDKYWGGGERKNELRCCMLSLPRSVMPKVANSSSLARSSPSMEIFPQETCFNSLTPFWDQHFPKNYSHPSVHQFFHHFCRIKKKQRLKRFIYISLSLFLWDSCKLNV